MITLLLTGFLLVIILSIGYVVLFRPADYTGFANKTRDQAVGGQISLADIKEIRQNITQDAAQKAKK